MIIGLFILFFSMLETGGGYEKIMTHIQTNHPDMLEPLSRGKMPISLYISQWLLVGVCTLALPQSVVRGISYKNTKALHNAMIIGTVVIGAMTLIATWIGVLSKGVLTDTLQAYGGSVDNITRLLSLAPWTFWPHHHHRSYRSNYFYRVFPAAGLLFRYHQRRIYARMLQTP